jgi:hypothetical protein
MLFLLSQKLLLDGSSALLFSRPTGTTNSLSRFSQYHLPASTLDSAQMEETTQAVDKLKKVLNREYVSFFDPMQRQYYSKGVSFDDPMTSLSGVDAYQNNVDMLASRTLLGKVLFQDSGIVLHSIVGGEVQPDGSISDIITRWTLRVTVKVLPWQPTARFSGISVYEVSSPRGSERVVIDHQTDYWDSINIQPGGEYAKVDKGIAIKDFLDQLKPDNGNAAAAGIEMPYQLLRRGRDYDVRRYPVYNAVTVAYDRRDEGYDRLATITKGVEPLTPAIIEVLNDDSKKTMSWPLNFASPGQSSPPALPKSVAVAAKEATWKDCDIGAIKSKVIAVGSFADASVAPVVRKADAKLREALKRDGIVVSDSGSLIFAQYDAIFTLGKRRGEVWIELEDGAHPWSE